jgi:hypothetical protein
VDYRSIGCGCGCDGKPWGVMMGSRMSRSPVGAMGFLSTYVGPQRSHPETGKQAALLSALARSAFALGRERHSGGGRLNSGKCLPKCMHSSISNSGALFPAVMMTLSLPPTFASPLSPFFRRVQSRFRKDLVLSQLTTLGNEVFIMLHVMFACHFI